MLVTSGKIKTDSIPENACPECDGVGKRLCISWDGSHSFEIGCFNCNGEKVITQDLIERKSAAARLRQLMIEARISDREAANRFGGHFIRDWNYAKQGRVPLVQIQEKIDLIVNEGGLTPEKESES
jgi:hypothetical protein